MRLKRLPIQALTPISLMLMCCAFALSTPAAAQTLASTIEVYVFPADGQDASQQSKDEAQCYDWATTNVGTDPFALQKQSQAQATQTQQQTEAAKQAGAGSGAKGALGGAAVGALIGEVASDDAGEGAAWGAAVGLIAGRRKAHQQESQATAQAQQQGAAAQQATAEQMENFKNAFSVCLEAKKYMVKY